MEFVAAANAFVAAHPNVAYGAVFLLAFLEAVPVIGSVLPGSVLIIGIAALIPTGTVQMWPLMIAAIVGAILGDGLPYWFGHRYREAILGRWPLDRYPGLVEKSRAFIHRHGGKSILLARFTPGVRGFVPVVAGIVAMPAGRFYAVNVLSAFIWAPAHILPGMLVGTSLALAGAAAGRLALLLVIIVALIWLLIWALRLAQRRGPQLISAAELQLRKWSATRDTWLVRQLRSLVDPERGETRVLLLWAGVVAVAAWLFLGILEDVVSGDPLVRIDAAIYHALQALRTPAGDALMIGITELGDTVVAAGVAVVVLLWLVWQRARRTAIYWTGAIGFAAAINSITKLAIHRARPGDLAYAGVSEFSFPSGHATVNAVLYGFLAFLITRQVRLAWRLPIFIAVAAFAVLMAFSRLYLGAHWFSDVVGSLAFATAWLVVLGLAYVRHHEKPFDRQKLALAACSALVLIGGLNVARKHAADTQRYAVHYEAPSITTAEWWATGWQKLPAYRIDLTGEDEEPLAFQWAGTLDGLKSKLLSSGWREPERWTTSSALAWLVTSDPQKLPVIPSLEVGRMPALTLIRMNGADANARVVLRLWPADYRLRDGRSYPLWVGSTVEERISRPLSFVTVAATKSDVTRSLDLLASSMTGGRLATRDTHSREWDGRVLLAQEGAPTALAP